MDTGIQFSLLCTHLFSPQIFFAHLLRIILGSGIQLVSFTLCVLTLTNSGFQIGFQLDAVRTQFFKLLQPNRYLKAFQLIAINQKLLGLLCLLAQGLYLQFQLTDLVIDTNQIFVRSGKFPLGLFLAMAESGYTRSLFKNLTTVGAFDGKYLVNAALADDGVTFPTQTSIHKQLIDVTQTAGTAVDIVFTFARTVIPTCDCNFDLLHREDVCGVIDHQCYLSKLHTFTLSRAVKDNILHLGATQRAGRLLAHYPTNGICNIGFSGAVRPDDRSNIGAKC